MIGSIWIHSWHFLVEISPAFLVSNSVRALFFAKSWRPWDAKQSKWLDHAGSEVVTHCSPIGPRSLWVCSNFEDGCPAATKQPGEKGVGARDVGCWLARQRNDWGLRLMFWQMMADGFGMSWDIQYLITIYLGYNHISGMVLDIYSCPTWSI